VFPELPAQFIMALDIGTFPAIPLTFKMVYPRFSPPVQFPLFPLSLHPPEDMFSYTGRRAEDGPDGMNFQDAFYGGFEEAFLIMRPVWESDFPFMHSSVASVIRLSQRDRWKNIIKLALGWKLSDILPNPDDCNVGGDVLYDEECHHFEFNPCKIISG
jgi:hypothetical protein